MHHIDTVFRTYNLSDEHSKDSFAMGVQKWAVIIKDITSTMSHSAIVARFGEILDEAWEATHIRCQLTEKLARDAQVGSQDENDDWCERAILVVKHIGFSFLRGTNGDVGSMQVRNVEKAHRGAEDILTLIWSEKPYCPDPDDRFGWRDYPTSKGIPTVIYYPKDHADPKKEGNSDEQDIERYFQEKRSEAYREALLSGQRDAFDALRLMLKARQEGLKAGGIKPRLHGLIIGPSGSGKTHVVRTVAEAEKLPRRKDRQSMKPIRIVRIPGLAGPIRGAADSVSSS